MAKKLNILLLGSGGREHALAWKIAQSHLLSKLTIAPGNAGMESLGQCIKLDVTDHQTVISFCEEHKIDLVVVGPEAPLVDGLADSLQSAGFDVFGPGAEAAQLEGSKRFTKILCDEHNIPTAAYGAFHELDAALAYLEAQSAPIVVKADGLAAGKGVIIAISMDEARAAVRDCFDGKFGAAGAEVVIEEFLDGEEASFFAISDGKNILPLVSAQDHKRVGDGDTGPNTGGMGAYSPAPVLTSALQDEVMTRIIRPTVEGMAARGTPFQGVLYAGLMITNEGPQLIEYNVRFGDPECQVLMLRLKSDLLEILHSAATGTLENISAEWSNDCALTVVMAAKGYPGSYEMGTPINGLDAASEAPDVEIFHAGTTRVDRDICANGGRVLNVSAVGKHIKEAQARAYHAVDMIDWTEGFCRRDIGWRAIAAEKTKDV